MVGVSDHTLGNGVSIAAVAVGAVVIERHFTLSRKDGGVDSAFSLEPQELKLLVEESKKAWKSLGAVKYGPTRGEKKSVLFRRSLYAVADIGPGKKINSRNVRAIRPGYGLPPKELPALTRMSAKRKIIKGEAIQWSMVK